MKFTREIKTAILAIASILLFIWGYSFLKGSDLLTSYKQFYVEYDNVEGLKKSAPITLNGLIIGKVKEIEFSNKTGKIKVELQINSDFPISKSSVVTLYESGLLSGKQIMIIPNLADNELAKNGSTLLGEIKPGMTDLVAQKLEPLQSKLEKILDNADKMVSGINSVLDKSGQENIKKALADLSLTIAEFHKTATGLNEIVTKSKTNSVEIIADFRKVSSNFAQISDSLNKADLGKTAKNLQISLEKVDRLLADLQAGKGTAGKMLKDEVLYANLTKSTKELELLLQDLRLNPTRYVNVSLFGKKNKPYVVPVSDSIKGK